MGYNATSKTLRVGATPVKILAADEYRENILIQLKTASKKLSIKINSAFNSAVTEAQTLTFDDTADAGTYKLNYGGNATTALAFDADAAAIQTALRLLAGLGSVTVTGDVATGFIITMTGVYAMEGDTAEITASDFATLLAGAEPVTPSIEQTTEGVLADGMDLLPDIIYKLGALQGDIWAKSSDSTVLVVEVIS